MDGRRSPSPSASYARSSARCRSCPSGRRRRVPEILIIAGETSGDLHAARVVRELVAGKAPFELVGIGGDAMEAAGVRLLEHARRLAALGLVEVLRHVPRHYALLRELRRRLKGGRVALLVLVDYPGFNMR